MSRLISKYLSGKNKANVVFLFLLCLFYSYPQKINAQDKIYKLDKTIISCKVFEISESEVRYRKIGNQNGPIYIISKEEVKKIVYENGQKENNLGKKKKSTSRKNKRSTGIRKFTKVEYLVGPNQKKARELLVNEKISLAIESYSLQIAQDSLNATLLAESAYALALAGIYDGALYRLDRSWGVGANSSDVNYFTSQVFLLMGYDDLATEFWESSDKNKIPSWILGKEPVLFEKYKLKKELPPIRSSDELIAKFNIANLLASEKSNFRSMVLFSEIVKQFPNEYLPYIGYSLTLESVGALEMSIKTVEKAISLMGSDAGEFDKKQVLEKRLKSLKKMRQIIPVGILPGLGNIDPMDIPIPQFLAYSGIMVTPTYSSLNFRLGLVTTDLSNVSLDLGVVNNDGTTSENVGFSAYSRKKSIIMGCGVNLLISSGKTNFNGKICIGYSKINKAGTGSFDIIYDFTPALTKGSIPTFGATIGRSVFFGKRKSIRK